MPKTTVKIAPITTAIIERTLATIRYTLNFVSTPSREVTLHIDKEMIPITIGAGITTNAIMALVNVSPEKEKNDGKIAYSNKMLEAIIPNIKAV